LFQSIGIALVDISSQFQRYLLDGDRFSGKILKSTMEGRQVYLNMPATLVRTCIHWQTGAVTFLTYKLKYDF